MRQELLLKRFCVFPLFPSQIIADYSCEPCEASGFTQIYLRFSVRASCHDIVSQIMMCRKSDSSKTDLATKGHSDRHWNNLLSALQPSVSPPVTKSEPVTTAQLQSITASCMKKNRAHQDEAVVNITEANVEQWLSQLSEATGEYNVIVSVHEITDNVWNILHQVFRYCIRLCRSVHHWQHVSEIQYIKKRHT